MHTGASDIYAPSHRWARGGKGRGFGCQSSLRGDKPRGGVPRRILLQPVSHV